MDCSQHESNNGKLKKTVIYGNNGNSKRSAIIGGCFNSLHSGHKEYIKIAFDFADEVFVLLSTDKYAKICKSYQVDPYEHRKKCLENYINEINGFKSYTIYELDSECSLIKFCLEKDITMALIVPEYYSLFEKINHLREDEGKPSLLLLIKQRTKTSEGFNITSTLIKNLSQDKRMSPFNYSPDLVIYDSTNQFKNNQPNSMPK